MTEEFGKKIDAVYDRAGFVAFRQFTSGEFGITGTSKSNLKESLFTAFTTDPSLLAKIEAFYTENLVCSSRQIEVHEINGEKDRDALDKYFKDLSVHSHSPLTLAFPYYEKEQSTLKSIYGDDLHIEKVLEYFWEDTPIKVACIGAIIKQQVPEPVAPYLNQAGEELLTSGAKFYLRQEVLSHLHHTVKWIPESGLLILSCDTSQGIRDSMAKDELYRLRKYIASEAGADISNPLNFFNAIGPLYDEGTGNLTELGLVTKKGNPVHFSLNRGETCIKRDQYHQVGEECGHVAGKFAVSKEWKFKATESRESRVSVSLKGKAAMLDTNGPLTDFRIGACPSFNGLSLLINKLAPHMTSTHA